MGCTCDEPRSERPIDSKDDVSEVHHAVTLELMQTARGADRLLGIPKKKNGPKAIAFCTSHVSIPVATCPDVAA